MEPMQLEGAGPASCVGSDVRGNFRGDYQEFTRLSVERRRMTRAAVGVLASGPRGACSVCVSSTQVIAKSSNGLLHVVWYRARCARAMVSLDSHHVHHAECAPSAIACGVGLTNVARVELAKSSQANQI